MKKATYFSLVALTFFAGMLTAKVLSKYDHISETPDSPGIIDEDDYDYPDEMEDEDPYDFGMIYGTDLSDDLQEDEYVPDAIPAKKSSRKSSK